MWRRTRGLGLHTDDESIFWQFFMKTFRGAALHVKVESMSREDEKCEEKAREGIWQPLRAS
jgi:hypothetical protein